MGNTEGSPEDPGDFDETNPESWARMEGNGSGNASSGAPADEEAGQVGLSEVELSSPGGGGGGQVASPAAPSEASLQSPDFVPPLEAGGEKAVFSPSSEPQRNLFPSVAEGDAWDPRDPWKGGVPLQELSALDLLVQSPKLLYQHVVAGGLYYYDNRETVRTELLSGVTVACMQVPESVAFSFVAGVDPLSGLFSTVFLGIITGLIGGKPGMISGAAGAMAVVAKDIMDENGPLQSLARGERFQHLMMTMTLCGTFQCLFGFLQLGGLVRLIPATAMIGFMNALAIVIFMSQLSAFQECPDYDRFMDCKENERKWLTLDQGETWLMLVIVAITMAVMHFFPKTPKVGKLFPGSMIALIVATFWEHVINRLAFDIPTRTVKETAAVSGDFPPFHLGDVSGTKHWGVIIRYGISLAAIGLVESIMTLNACDEITSTPQSIFRANQESVAQGVSNFVSSLFGAMGGDAMIGQSTINIMNGARCRLSSTSAGIFLLIFVLVASKVIELLPIAGLTGVLFMVVLSTFHWATFQKLPRMQRSDAFVLVVVTTLAVVFDLAIGVVVGVVLTALCATWNGGNELVVVRRVVQGPGDMGDVAIYEVRGNLFFASCTQFKNSMDETKDPAHTVLDFARCSITDYSAVAAVKSMYKRYLSQKKTLHVRNMHREGALHFKKDKKLSVALNISPAEDQEANQHNAKIQDLIKDL